MFQNPDDQIFKYKVLDEVMFGPLNIGMSKETAEKQAAVTPPQLYRLRDALSC